MQVVWAGTELEPQDVETGHRVRFDTFVALLPFSGMLFASAHRTQRLDSWINVHHQAFDYFGGPINLVIPGNASTASNQISCTSKRHRANPTSENFLGYQDTAAVPARARKPREKVVWKRP